MDLCLWDDDCKLSLAYNYGQKLTIVVTAFNKGLLKKLDTVKNLIIIYDANNYYFEGTAVDILKIFVTSKCKSEIKLLNYFPFYFQYSGESEAQGKYCNMNCFSVEAVWQSVLQDCIPTDSFNIYDIRNDTKINKVVCYKQLNNTVYNAFEDIIKIDFRKQNGGVQEQELFKELPRDGTSLINTCIPNCQDCQSYKKCNECEPGYFLKQDECIQCHSTCLICKNYQACLTCKQNLGLYKDLCVQNCPEGYIKLSGVCKQCGLGCRVCEKITSNCTQCFDNFVLQNNTCQPTCNDGFFLESHTSKCISCPNGCIQCQDQDYCQTCGSNFSKQNSLCVTECDSNYVSISRICNKCSKKCDGCYDSPDQCKHCSKGFYMQNHVCELSCKSGFYQDEEKRSCERCYQNCQRCTGPKRNDCQYCSEKACIYYSFNINTQQNDMFCIQNQTEMCEFCGVRGECLKCKPSYKLIKTLSKNVSCVQKCPEGYREEEEKCLIEFRVEQSNLEKQNILIVFEILVGTFMIITLIILCYKLIQVVNKYSQQQQHFSYKKSKQDSMESQKSQQKSITLQQMEQKEENQFNFLQFQQFLSQKSQQQHKSHQFSQQKVKESTRLLKLSSKKSQKSQLLPKPLYFLSSKEEQSERVLNLSYEVSQKQQKQLIELQSQCSQEEQSCKSIQSSKSPNQQSQKQSFKQQNYTF